MRSIEEIKAEIKWRKTDDGLEWTAESSITNADRLKYLGLELRAALTADIPLDRLEEICAAERDGRCVVLPCKAGSTVYVRSGCLFSRYASTEHYTPCEVVNIRYGKKGGPVLYLRPLTVDATRSKYHRLWVASAIGVTAFLTREAAEAAKEVAEGGF